MLVNPLPAGPSAIAPASLLPVPNSFDVIWRLAEAGATLTRLERAATAKSLLNDTCSIVEVWYGEVAAGGATEEARAGFISDLRQLLAWAEKAIRTIEVERMEQLTATRAHVAA